MQFVAIPQRLKHFSNRSLSGSVVHLCERLRQSVASEISSRRNRRQRSKRCQEPFSLKMAYSVPDTFSADMRERGEHRPRGPMPKLLE